MVRRLVLALVPYFAHVCFNAKMLLSCIVGSVGSCVFGA